MAAFSSRSIQEMQARFDEAMGTFISELFEKHQQKKAEWLEFAEKCNQSSKKIFEKAAILADCSAKHLENVIILEECSAKHLENAVKLKESSSKHLENAAKHLEDAVKLKESITECFENALKVEYLHTGSSKHDENVANVKKYIENNEKLEEEARKCKEEIQKEVRIIAAKFAESSERHFENAEKLKASSESHLAEGQRLKEIARNKREKLEKKEKSILAQLFHGIFDKNAKTPLAPEMHEEVFNAHLANRSITIEENTEGKSYAKINSMSSVIAYREANPHIKSFDFRAFAEIVDIDSFARYAETSSLKAVAFKKSVISVVAKTRLDRAVEARAAAGNPFKVQYFD